jgi:hypothetical protein
MDTPLWCYVAEKQALVFFDPAHNGQGQGFSIPAIERAGYWQPHGTLELAIRKTTPAMPGPPMIQPVNRLPPQGFPSSVHARRR